MNDDATVMTSKSAASAKGLPKCVCSWKNCRTYQKAYKSYGHSILDGIVKVKFIKGDTASIPLKASVDRTLKVPKEKRQDWKPAKGEELIRYNIARHHFTEAHIQRYCQDPKRYRWTSLFSEAEAKKYLFKLDPKETMSLGDARSARSFVFWLPWLRFFDLLPSAKAPFATTSFQRRRHLVEQERE